jgi:hypothetical protein
MSNQILRPLRMYARCRKNACVLAWTSSIVPCGGLRYGPVCCAITGATHVRKGGMDSGKDVWGLTMDGSLEELSRTAYHLVPDIFSFLVIPYFGLQCVSCATLNY